MTKAVKCPKCGLYYNGQVYNECPHCKSKQAPGAYSAKEEKPREYPVRESIPQREDRAEHECNIPRQKRFTVPYDETRTGTEHWEAKEPAAQEDNEPNKEKEASVPQKTVKKAEPEQNAFADGLLKQLKKSGRTVGKFTSADGENIDPVVGWVVCVKGAYYGQSFALRSGKNKIGRSQEFDIRLLNDDSVSRSCVASIVFDTKAVSFSIMPGESDSLCYVNGEALYERRPLTGYEQIELGDSERNMFVFVPLCGERFTWLSYQAAK